MARIGSWRPPMASASSSKGEPMRTGTVDPRNASRQRGASENRAGDARVPGRGIAGAVEKERRRYWIVLKSVVVEVQHEGKPSLVLHIKLSHHGGFSECPANNPDR